MGFKVGDRVLVTYAGSLRPWRKGSITRRDGPWFDVLLDGDKMTILFHVSRLQLDVDPPYIFQRDAGDENDSRFAVDDHTSVHVRIEFRVKRRDLDGYDLCATDLLKWVLREYELSDLVNEAHGTIKTTLRYRTWVASKEV